jgi:hypothetical protein
MQDFLILVTTYFLIVAPYVLSLAAGILIVWLIYKRAQIARQRDWLAQQRYVLLQIQVPRDNEKKPLAAEQMFAALHGILKSKKQLKKEGSVQEHIGFEIVSVAKYIRFFIFTPAHLRDFVEGQLYAQYPTVEIAEVEDYVDQVSPETFLLGTNLELIRDDVYPIKTFADFDVDPLASITAVLSKLDSAEEQIWIQILAKPIDDTWQKKGLAYIARAKGGAKMSFGAAIFSFVFGMLGEIIKGFFFPPSEKKVEKKKVGEAELSEPEKQALKLIGEKSNKLGYEVKVRVVVAARDPYSAKTRLQGLVGTFKQYNLINLNGFTAGKIETDRQKILTPYRARAFDKKGFILNIQELASIFHLPNVSVETPNIVWAGAKKGEPPHNLPIPGTVAKEDLTIFAKTNFRHVQQEFGIKLLDRRLHMYILGKTGMGKSQMLENMALDDILEGRGVGVVDPHGDLVEKILSKIPSYRSNDVVILDPSDLEFPVAFNLLENVQEDARSIVASGLISIFKKIWAGTWGPRLEHILRNTILALLEYPDSTLLGITRMLTDKNFRADVVKKVTDPVVKAFWETEFGEYNDKFRTEAIAPVLNKVGQFLSSAAVRNILGQPKSTIDIRKIMDEGKILLVKIAKGSIGEDNSALLGAMIITKIQLAAMSRTDIPEEKRRDFYLYVDEFQNFATESFAVILSEARKYHLNLTVANQYIAQMEDVVREAVFGNVGTMITFRIGAADAKAMVPEFAPVFDEGDFVNLNKYHIYAKLAIDGITQPAFSAVTLPPLELPLADVEKIKALCRERYARPRTFVEEKISEWAEKSFAAEKPRIFAAREGIMPHSPHLRQERGISEEEYVSPMPAVIGAKPQGKSVIAPKPREISEIVKKRLEEVEARKGSRHAEPKKELVAEAQKSPEIRVEKEEMGVSLRELKEKEAIPFHKKAKADEKDKNQQMSTSVELRTEDRGQRTAKSEKDNQNGKTKTLKPGQSIKIT